jgi:hypothetical protein
MFSRNSSKFHSNFRIFFNCLREKSFASFVCKGTLKLRWDQIMWLDLIEKFQQFFYLKNAIIREELQKFLSNTNWQIENL